MKQMAAAGFEVVRIETFMREDNIHIARPKPAGKLRAVSDKEEQCSQSERQNGG